MSVFRHTWHAFPRLDVSRRRPEHHAFDVIGIIIFAIDPHLHIHRWHPRPSTTSPSPRFDGCLFNWDVSRALMVYLPPSSIMGNRCRCVSNGYIVKHIADMSVSIRWPPAWLSATNNYTIPYKQQYLSTTKNETYFMLRMAEALGLTSWYHMGG